MEEESKAAGEAALQGQGPPAAESALSAEEERLKREARQALENNDFSRASEALERLVGTPFANEARTLLLRGLPSEALASAERGLEVAPLHSELLLVRGESQLILASADGDAVLLAESLQAFQAAGDSPDAHFGSARALLALGRGGEALASAQRARARKSQSPAQQSSWLPTAESHARTFSRAALAALAAQPTPSDPAADQGPVLSRQELQGLCELALDEERKLQPQDPWAWVALTDFYADLGRPEAALTVCERGLFKHVPRAAELHQRYVAFLAAAGGTRAVVEAYTRFRLEQPQVALGYWMPARARFDEASAQIARDPRSELRAIEGTFARARQLDRSLTLACLHQEALCRTAIGWCHVEFGRLEDAGRVFESTEELFQGASAVRVDGRVRSAREGLEVIAREWAGRDELGQAAKTYLLLHKLDSGKAEWARACGRFQRDHASRLELAAVDASRAGNGKLREERRLAQLRGLAEIPSSLWGTERERDLMRDAAGKLKRRANEAYARSHSAFLAACGADQNDLRSQVDAACVAVYHMGAAWQEAEPSLRQAIESGRARLTEPQLDAETRIALEEAWGDAHQALGFLYLEHRGEPDKAVTWLEASLKIGSAPRLDVERDYLPRARAALAVPRGRPGD